MTWFSQAVTLFTVRIDAHHIEPRFDIPEQEHRIYAQDERAARREAVYVAARAAGISGWRPWLRRIYVHSRVVRVQSQKDAMLDAEKDTAVRSREEDSSAFAESPLHAIRSRA